MRLPVWGAFVIIILLMASGSVLAEARQRRQASELVVAMTQTLRLNREQIRQITPVVETQLAQIAMIKEGELDEDEKKARLAVLQKDLHAQLELYLTPGQLEQWDKSAARIVTREAGPEAGTSDTPRTEAVANRSADGVVPDDSGVLQSHGAHATHSGIY